MLEILYSNLVKHINHRPQPDMIAIKSKRKENRTQKNRIIRKRKREKGRKNGEKNALTEKQFMAAKSIVLGFNANAVKWCFAFSSDLFNYWYQTAK